MLTPSQVKESPALRFVPGRNCILQSPVTENVVISAWKQPCSKALIPTAAIGVAGHKEDRRILRARRATSAPFMPSNNLHQFHTNSTSVL
jgi:hypothetical protein